MFNGIEQCMIHHAGFDLKKFIIFYRNMQSDAEIVFLHIPYSKQLTEGSFVIF